MANMLSVVSLGATIIGICVTVKSWNDVKDKLSIISGNNSLSNTHKTIGNNNSVTNNFNIVLQSGNHEDLENMQDGAMILQK